MKYDSISNEPDTMDGWGADPGEICVECGRLLRNGDMAYEVTTSQPFSLHFVCVNCAKILRGDTK